MQSSKTFVMVDRPFWKDKDPETGRDATSMTLTDRLTRGTYLFDNGPDKPGVICLSYAWMGDALKMLPQSPEKRVRFALGALKKICPKEDIAGHIIGNPITVSWEADPRFLGAFKGALPGQNERAAPGIAAVRLAAGRCRRQPAPASPRRPCGGTWRRSAAFPSARPKPPSPARCGRAKRWGGRRPSPCARVSRGRRLSPDAG